MADFTSELDATLTQLLAQVAELKEQSSKDQLEAANIQNKLAALELTVVNLTQKIVSDQGAVSPALSQTIENVRLISNLCQSFDRRLFILENPRKSLVAGTYIPGKDTTGHVGTLQRIPGNISTTADNQVFENVFIDGWINIKHNGVKLINCHIKAGTPAAGDTDAATVKCYRELTVPAELIDCTIEADVNSPLSGCGVKGRNIKVIRCNIFGSVDGIMAINSGLVATGNWIHGLPKHATSPFHSDGSHSDGIQVEGGSGHVIVGNFFEMGRQNNAAIMVTQNAALINGLVIESNWFRSTEKDPALQTPVALNFYQSKKGGMKGVRVAKNQFSLANTWRNTRAAFVDGQTYDDMIANNNLVENIYEDGTPAKFSRSNVAS